MTAKNHGGGVSTAPLFFKAHHGRIFVRLGDRECVLSRSGAHRAAMDLLSVIDNANAHTEQKTTMGAGLRRVDCRKCGRIWKTETKPGNTTRCPQCRAYRRISTTGKDDND